jgi:hypothetical protein
MPTNTPKKDLNDKEKSEHITLALIKLILEMSDEQRERLYNLLK